MITKTDNAVTTPVNETGAVELTEAELGKASGGFSWGEHYTPPTTTVVAKPLGYQNLGDTATHEAGH